MDSSPPPSASAFLQKHTHHAETEDDKAASSVSGGATEIVSNLIELVGRGAQSGEDDVVSVNSMKHRNSVSSYDQRVPKMSYEDGDGNPIPYKGFARPATTEAPVQPGRFAGLRYRLRGIFSPRATDVEQLLVKLQTQFDQLEVDFRVYALKKDGSRWDEEDKPGKAEKKNDRKDPNHPLNNAKLMTDIHFVGRKAKDPAIVEISTLLTNRDRFGCITELWLNNNLISDDGAAAIASFLQLPTCALVELWLGDNQIGPAGTTLISGALSNNETTKLKCLGLYLNPIGNGGATTIAQMLRKNHTLSTVDIHGCGTRGRGPEGGPEVLEGYGCKVIKASDGTEYIARVVSTTDEEEGVVTDQRLLDAIQTFVAFNRINPTREQAIRGIMTSNKQGIQDDSADDKGEQTSEQKYQTKISNFLSGLCNEPANEKLTDREKRTWKDCEWERLRVELERARVVKKAMANRLSSDAKKEDEKTWQGDFPDVEEGTSLVESDGSNKGDETKVRRDLDDEVVQTDVRSWRDLKVGITGSARVGPKPRNAPASNGQKMLDSIPDADSETEDKPGTRTPPPSAFQDGFVSKSASSEMDKANAISDLERALESVTPVNEGAKTPEGEDDPKDLAF